MTGDSTVTGFAIIKVAIKMILKKLKHIVLMTFTQNYQLKRLINTSIKLKRLCWTILIHFYLLIPTKLDLVGVLIKESIKLFYVAEKCGSKPFWREQKDIYRISLVMTINCVMGIFETIMSFYSKKHRH